MTKNNDQQNLNWITSWVLNGQYVSNRWDRLSAGHSCTESVSDKNVQVRKGRPLSQCDPLGQGGNEKIM